MKDLEGKVAVVIEGSQGIGLGIARALADKGTNLVISSRCDSRNREAVKHLSKCVDKPFYLRY